TLVILSITGVGLLIPAVAKNRDNLAKAQCANNLKQLGLGLSIFHATYKSFPSGTYPNKDLPPEKRLSWLLLPAQFAFCDSNEVLLIDKEKAWDSEENNGPKSKTFRPHEQHEKKKWNDPRP